MGKKIMRNQRTFVDGIQNVNGFIVNVIRFVGAQQISATSRIAAKHWGTITTPSGEVIDMGESGMTTPQIKKIVGGETKSYNRGGGSGAIKALEKLKSQLEALGMSTEEVDAKIEAEKARIEEEKSRIVNSAEIKKLEKVKVQLESLGLSVIEVTWKIADLEAQIAQLR